MIYEEAIVDGVLCWRNSPRDCKGHGPWIQKTPQELTAMLLEARQNARPLTPPIFVQPFVVYPVVQPSPQPTWKPYEVTC